MLCVYNAVLVLRSVGLTSLQMETNVLRDLSLIELAVIKVYARLAMLLPILSSVTGLENALSLVDARQRRSVKTLGYGKGYRVLIRL